MDQGKDNTFADELLASLFKPRLTLKELFEKRIQEINITSTTAADILKIQYRTLNGILEGTQKMVDYVNLIKLANFLRIDRDKLIKLYLEVLEKNFPDDSTDIPDKIQFIQENFDLSAFKKAGFIKSKTDYEEFERKIVNLLGLRTIFDYEQPKIDVAFSVGGLQPKSNQSRSIWIKTANDVLKTIKNPYKYDRDALVNFFPQIRWHSKNIDLGLNNVIRALYKIGVTVLYQPPLPSLQVRGATFSVYDKPCIVLTNYVGFYATLWFALVHELFHVLFDWEEISLHSYHLSDDLDNDRLSVIEREREADDFAREYLFSKEKMEKVKPYIGNHAYINNFAHEIDIHPSFIYTFYAFDCGRSNKTAWGKARLFNPNFEHLLSDLGNSWQEAKPIAEFVSTLKKKIYY